MGFFLDQSFSKIDKSAYLSYIARRLLPLVRSLFEMLKSTSFTNFDYPWSDVYIILKLIILRKPKIVVVYEKIYYFAVLLCKHTFKLNDIDILKQNNTLHVANLGTIMQEESQY